MSGAGSAVAKARASNRRQATKPKSAECSKAAHDWKTHGMTPQTAATLGKCHASGHAVEAPADPPSPGAATAKAKATLASSRNDLLATLHAAKSAPKVKPPKLARGIHVAPGEVDSLDANSHKMFGRKLSLHEYASLAGAPSNATTTVSPMHAGGGIRISFRAPGIKGTRMLIPGEGAHPKPKLVNDEFSVSKAKQGQGHGTTMLHSQAHAAAAIGIKEIHTKAIRDKNSNGYYTWPRLGYDGNLSAAHKAKLPSHLSHSTRLSDLVKTEEGRAWWKEHGDTARVTFDTSPGSLSRKVLDAYVAGRKKRDG